MTGHCLLGRNTETADVVCGSMGLVLSIYRVCGGTYLWIGAIRQLRAGTTFPLARHGRRVRQQEPGTGAWSVRSTQAPTTFLQLGGEMCPCMALHPSHALSTASVPGPDSIATSLDFAPIPAIMYVCKDSAAPAHARTRAHMPAAPHQNSGVSQTPHPTACPQAGIPHRPP